MHTHTQMTSKNLAVREDVYRKLLEAKKGSESFSDVIDRLLEGKNNMMAFAGILSDDKEFEKARGEIRRVRRGAVLRN